MNENENHTNTGGAPAPNPKTDITKKNASFLWGMLILLVGGIIGIVGALSGLLDSRNDGTWIFYIEFLAIPSVIVGVLLLGISAVVDRLNEVIKQLRDSNK